MRVYAISNKNGSGVLYAVHIDDVILEVKEEIEGNGPRPDEGITLENIPKFRKALENLELVSESADGVIAAKFGTFIVTLQEISQEEYSNMPEFDGW